MMIFLLVCGLFVGLFPWLFSFKGTILGRPLSIRALGDAVGIVMALFGLAVLFWPRLRAATERKMSELDVASPAAKTKILLTFVGVYAIGVISHKLRAQYSLGTHAHDLGFFSNVCWNTSVGNYFYSSLYEVPFLSRHVNLILWPLSFFYKFGFGASVLLVAQALMIGASIPFLWRITERVTGSFSWGMIISMLFVCSPFIGHLVGNDFHPKAWFAPFLLATMWAWQRNTRWQILLFGLIMLLAEEDAPIAMSGFALFLMLDPEFRKTGTLLLAMSLGVFFFYTQWLIPHFIGTGTPSMMFTRYALGSSYKEWVTNLIFHPSVYWDAIVYEPTKYLRMLSMVLPTAGVAFFAPLMLLPALFALAPHFLAHNGLQLSLADIYALPAQPFIFVAAALGLARLMKQESFYRRKGYLMGLCFFVAGIGAYRTPKFFKSESSARLSAFYELKKLIPAEASLVAQQNLYPHFDTRRYIQIFPMGTTMPEFDKSHFLNPAYIICDRMGNTHPYSREEWEFAIRAVESSGDYQLIAEKEGFLVFKRLEDEPLRFRDASPNMHEL